MTSSLSTNFIRHLTYLKRYCIRTYTHGETSTDDPLFCVDIIQPQKCKHATTAEVIQIAVELLSQFTPLESEKWSIMLSHSQLIEEIFTVCGIREELRKTVATVISSGGSGRQARLELELTKPTARRLIEVNIYLLAFYKKNYFYYFY